MFPPMDWQKDAANRPVFLDISWFEFFSRVVRDKCWLQMN